MNGRLSLIERQEVVLHFIIMCVVGFKCPAETLHPVAEKEMLRLKDQKPFSECF